MTTYTLGFPLCIPVPQVVFVFSKIKAIFFHYSSHYYMVIKPKQTNR